MWQAVLLVLTLFLLQYFEKTAFLRGTKGDDSFSRFGKKFIRSVFLFVVFCPLISFVPYWVFFTLLLLYIPSYTDLSELNGGRPSAWMRSWGIWTYLKNYFPLSLIKTVDLDPKKVYLLALHPHGILPFGAMINLLSECNHSSKILEGITFRTLAASFCFYIPGYREILLGGGVCDASRYSASQLLEKGISILLVPGGATEALYTDPDQDVLYLKSRKGFIKLAMTHGVDIVPVFSFNECRTYGQLPLQNPIVQYIKKKFQSIFGISLPLITNILPKRVPISTVIGSPIEIPHIKEPTDEQVSETLKKYIAGVEKFYNEQGAKYNIPKNKTLKIV